MTIQQTAEAFVANRNGRSPGRCPGGAYVTSNGDTFYSYNTEIGRRLTPTAVAVTPMKYSAQTTYHTNQLKDALHAAGYQPTNKTVDVSTRVPGRHGGYGIPWHPTGWETYPFVIWQSTEAGF